MPSSGPVSAGRYPLRWLLVATVIPLFSFLAATNDTKDRVEETLDQHPELRGEDLTIDEFCARLPERKVEGAFVERGSKIHWLFAIVAAAGFWAYVMLAFPLGAAKAGHLWLVGLFTGTVGIFLLLAMQYAALHTRGVVVGRGAAVIIFLIVRFIGFSYGAALDPENGFVASLAGFTFGVGLCEELVKALPLLWIFRRESILDVRGAIAWGLATGVGFGVSEGITYAADYYNGIETGQVYIVRFVSCVGLHAVWSATSALLIWRLREEIADIEAWYGWIFPVGVALGASMVLHGLYDTFLKRGMGGAALAAAVVSLVLFFVLAHRMERREELEAA